MTRYAHYRAPHEEGAALVEPSGEALLRSVASGRTARDSLLSRCTFAGVPGQELAHDARADLLRIAARHTGRWGGDETHRALDPDAPLLLSGHQPDLFHPGVWFKNFLLDRLAKACGGVGVHLVIDSDLRRNTAIDAPAGSTERPRLRSVAFDSPGPPLPHEERALLDPELFATFPDRARETFGSWVREPLVDELWRHASAFANSSALLGDALSEPRRRLERAWGVHNLEAPLSEVCDTGAFRRFTLELLLRAPAFSACHNQALADYRTAHRLRNAAQPLPDLAEREGWVEAPLWMWTKDDPRRRGLWTQRAGDGLRLSDLESWEATLPEDPERAIDQLAELRDRGVKLRSRALVTTLYARLLLGDQFLHGIGGAKYDQVTDDLSTRFFGAPPPPHVTATATLWLPIDRHAAGGHPSAGLPTLRELRYHPEAYLQDPRGEVADWVEQKREAVRMEKTPRNAADRHRRIEQANLALQAAVEPIRERVEHVQKAEALRRAASAVTDSREYAFCLFPANDLRTRLTRLAEQAIQG